MSQPNDLLRVAPPRQRNTQQMDDSTATPSATPSATTDLKTLADRYLERKKRNTPRNNDEITPPKTAQQTGDFEGAFVALESEHVAYSEERPDWLPWIDERCQLLPEDRAHIVRGLFRIHPKLQRRLAERYVETWRAAADDEPKYHKRDNAGRRAANMTITRLLNGKDSDR